MLKFIQNTRLPSVVFGSAALIALISAAPVTPATAQVPAGLLRLDSSQAYYYDRAYNEQLRLTQAQQAQVRSAYASAPIRKHHHRYVAQ
jgi:hypothetical protein